MSNYWTYLLVFSSKLVSDISNIPDIKFKQVKSPCIALHTIQITLVFLKKNVLKVIDNMLQRANISYTICCDAVNTNVKQCNVKPENGKTNITE